MSYPKQENYTKIGSNCLYIAMMLYSFSENINFYNSVTISHPQITSVIVETCKTKSFLFRSVKQPGEINTFPD